MAHHSVTPEELVLAVKDPIARLGGGYMVSGQAKTKSKELGTGGWGLYMIGRGGPLGDVDPAVVTAAMHFFPYERVATNWTRARAVVTPQEGAAVWAGVCHEWASVHLADAKGLDRLAELLPKVIAAADASGRTLFAGWAAMPLPEDPAGRVAQLCHVLREFRGASHGMACAVNGLTPRQAVLTGGGSGNADFFGWPEPNPDVTELAPRKADAEALTDRLVTPAWTSLDADEQAEVATLLSDASEAAFVSMSR